jgi:hypothetical protein
MILIAVMTVRRNTSACSILPYHELLSRLTLFKASECCPVRGPGKSSGAFAFALTFLVLFLSRKKEQQSVTTIKQRPNSKQLHKDNGKTNKQNQYIPYLSGFIIDATILMAVGY